MAVIQPMGRGVDDGLERVVRQAVGVGGGFVEHQHQNRVTMSARLGRSRSVGVSLAVPIWTKPAIRSSGCKPEGVEHPPVEGGPAGEPGGAIAEGRRPRGAGSCRRRRPREPAPNPGSSHAASRRDTTATTSGAWAKRSRSAATCRASASGLSAWKAAASDLAEAAGAPRPGSG